MINDRKIELLYRYAQGAVFATTLASAIITAVFWPYVDTSILLPWFSCLLAVNGIRHALIYRFNHSHDTVENKAPWLYYFLAGAVIGGCLWGFISVYIINTVPLHLSTIIILLTGYLVMGASFTYALFPSVFAAFTLPLIIPVITSLLVQPDNAARTLGILLGIFLAYAVGNALRNRDMTLSFISYQFENRSLFEHLLQEKAAASGLNEELERDLERLRQTEEKLKQEKLKAEELANMMARISAMDGLTGIANRRQFDESLAREWNRALRSRAPLSLILCDIDHFKAYNDCYGHQEGDRCLIKVAHILEEYARRAGDMAARYGGEEFALILPETSLENAADIAEQIRRDINNLAMLHYTSETSNIVTVSFGVATAIPQSGLSPQTLIARADKVLYQAKLAGRDRVIAAKPEIQESAAGYDNKAS